MRRRVVVTGVGCVNPLGHNVEELWKALQEGKSGVAATTIFDASSFPTKIAAEVKHWDVSKEGEDLATLEKPQPSYLLCRRSCQTSRRIVRHPRWSGTPAHAVWRLPRQWRRNARF